MAIGNGNEDGNKNGLYENTYYSRIRMKNAESKLSLGISYRSGLLIISIAEPKGDYKYEDLQSIYLSPTKCKILHNELVKFMEYYNTGDIIPNKAYGVNAGMNEKVSYIGFHADEDKNIIATIGKFDGNGQIVEQASTMLNRDYHFGLEWDNIEAMDLTKVYYDDIEISQIMDIVEDFSRYMNGALAYSVADLTRYDTARVLNKMNPIYDKLGIEKNYGSNNRGSNNFLNNTGSNSQSTHTSIDDII